MRVFGVPELHSVQPLVLSMLEAGYCSVNQRSEEAPVKNTIRLSLVLAAVLSVWVPADLVKAQGKPAVQVPPMPQPGVPEIFTMEGKFVRAAYNNEGYVIIGYQPANRSVGEEWMMLEIGITVRDNVKSFKMMRDALSVDTPDGKNLPLPSVTEFRAANTNALQNRAKVQRDSINYFPPMASRACRIGFFSDLIDPVMAYDEVEISNTRACLGRVYFHVPGGIKYGQHWFNVKFPSGVIRVPFRILTDDEERMFSKNYKSISQQVDDAFKKKK